jgi:hypothetical protein
LLDRMEATVRALVAETAREAARGVGMKAVTTTVQHSRPSTSPCKMADTLHSCFEQAADMHAAGNWVNMPSGALHDTAPVR